MHTVIQAGDVQAGENGRELESLRVDLAAGEFNCSRNVYPVDDTSVAENVAAMKADRQAKALKQAAIRCRCKALCLRHGLPVTIKRMDYRYWECHRCGFNPEDAATWAWWSRLHYSARDALLALSPRSLIHEPKLRRRPPADR